MAFFSEIYTMLSKYSNANIILESYVLLLGSIDFFNMSLTKSSAPFEGMVEDPIEDPFEDVVFNPDIYIFCIYFSAGASKISE
jgi:hypothetical protein